MDNELRRFMPLTLDTRDIKDIPKCISCMITHTGLLGVLTVSNELLSGDKVAFQMSVGETISLTDGQIKNSIITVACDADSTARVIYWI